MAETPGCKRRSRGEPSQAQPGHGAILVIEDDAVIRDGVRTILERDGRSVLAAADGREGLAIARRYRPALILLDMRLPYLSGWELAEALAQDGLDIPIVVMAAAREAPDWATAIGARACLGKPFGRAQLLEVVDRFGRP